MTGTLPAMPRIARALVVSSAVATALATATLRAPARENDSVRPEYLIQPDD